MHSQTLQAMHHTYHSFEIQFLQATKLPSINQLISANSQSEGIAIYSGKKEMVLLECLLHLS